MRIAGYTVKGSISGQANTRAFANCEGPDIMYSQAIFLGQLRKMSPAEYFIQNGKR